MSESVIDVAMEAVRKVFEEEIVELRRGYENARHIYELACEELLRAASKAVEDPCSDSVERLGAAIKNCQLALCTDEPSTKLTRALNFVHASDSRDAGPAWEALDVLAAEVRRQRMEIGELRDCMGQWRTVAESRGHDLRRMRGEV